MFHYDYAQAEDHLKTYCEALLQKRTSLQVIVFMVSQSI